MSRSLLMNDEKVKLARMKARMAEKSKEAEG